MELALNLYEILHELGNLVRGKGKKDFWILNFRPVLIVICCLLGKSSASM